VPLEAAVRNMEEPRQTPSSTPVSAAGTADRQRRLLREMRSLMRSPHPNIDVFPCESDMGFWRLVLAMDQAPDMYTPYAAGCWLLYILFPSEYPERAPEVRFVTPIKHCNVNAHGRICHSILDRNYTTDTSVSDILSQVYALVLSPDPEDAVDTSLALSCHNDPETYRRSISEHVQRFAVARDRLAWKAALESEPDAQGVQSVDVSSLGPQTPIRELREFIVRHDLPIVTGGPGRTRAAILQDIYNAAAARRAPGPP